MDMPVIVSAVLLAAAQLVQPADPPVSRIVVQGFGSVKTPPTVASLSYDVRGDGATSDRAVASMVAVSTAVEGSLRSIDPNIAIHSDSVRIQAVRPKGCEGRDYDDDSTPRLSSGECGITGYLAAQDFNVRTSRVADAGTLVGLAGRHGAYNPKIESFGLADETAAKRAAIASAMADASVKADAVAIGTGVRRGQIVSVSLDNARQQDMAIIVTGTVSARMVEREKAIEVSVNPSPVETTAQVTVSYAIGR
jgi:uncharacterized protein YggE